MNETSDRTDNRQIMHFQKYRSEIYTLAKTGSVDYDRGTGNLCLAANAKIVIQKEDLRLPLSAFVAFEPDGGDPNEASINAHGYQAVGGASLRLSITEKMLVKRSYVPTLRVAGSSLEVGKVDVPARPGALGYSFGISNECDAVEIEAMLPYACGGVQRIIPEGPSVYWPGKWLFGYTFTCLDRLSREEWTNAVSKTNVMIQVYPVDASFGAGSFSGIPTIIKDAPG